MCSLLLVLSKITVGSLILLILVSSLQQNVSVQILNSLPLLDFLSLLEPESGSILFVLLKVVALDVEAYRQINIY